MMNMYKPKDNKGTQLKDNAQLHSLWLRVRMYLCAPCKDRSMNASKQASKHPNVTYFIYFVSHHDEGELCRGITESCDASATTTNLLVQKLGPPTKMMIFYY